MVTGVISASDFSNFEPKLIAETRYTLQYKTLMPQLVRRERLPESMGRTYNVPKHGTVTATALTEGVPLAVGQIPSQGNTAIVPAEVGVEVILTDVALGSGRDDYARQMGRVMGDAMAKKLDVDGIAQFPSFTTTIGTSGTARAVGHITAAVARLASAAEPAPKPWWYVDRPEPMRLILNTVAPTGTYPVAAGLSREIMDMYFLHDFKLYGLSGGFATVNQPTSGATDTTGCIFSQDSIIYVEAHPVRFERDRDIELRGWLLTSVARYAYGIYVATWGVPMNGDATAPVA